MLVICQGGCKLLDVKYRGKNWSSIEIELLKSNNLTVLEISNKINRTISAIVYKAQKLKIQLLFNDKLSKDKICRSCGSQFQISEEEFKISKQLFHRCYRCKNTSRNSQKLQYIRKKNNNLCVRCGVLLINQKYKQLCTDCTLKHTKSIFNRRHKNIENNQCGICGKNEEMGIKICAKCWFKSRASDLGNRQKWIDYYQIWNKQNRKCPFLNIDLVPGKNLSIDHITPISRNGSNDISNLRMVDINVNRMKGNLMDEEFITIMKNIFVNLKGE